MSLMSFRSTMMYMFCVILHGIIQQTNYTTKLTYYEEEIFKQLVTRFFSISAIFMKMIRI